MKRLAILLCGLTSLLSAGPTIIVRGPVYTGGSGAWQQVINNDGNTGQLVGDDASRIYGAGSFSAANSGTVTSIVLNLRENGTDNSGTDTIDFAIYSDSSGSPGSALTNGTISAISLNDLPDVYGDHTFTFSTPPSITSGTTYWIVIKANQTSATENVSFRYHPISSLAIKSADSTPSWSDVDTSAAIRATVNGSN